MNRSLIYWNVEEIDRNIVLITLKKNITVTKKVSYNSIKDA